MLEFLSKLFGTSETSAGTKAENALRQANAELEKQIEALRVSEERFRLLVDGTKDYAIFMLDPTGRIASWNSGAERIKGYRADEIIGQHFSRFYSADDVQAGKPDQELQVAAAEGRCEDEGWRIRKDGSRFWANVVITALRDEGGNLRGFSKITRDITERKQSEENARRLAAETAARTAAEERTSAIREERERLRVTLHSIGDGVIVTDAEGRVTLLNPVAESLTGWQSAEAEGHPLPSVFTIINEQTRKPAENPVSKALREGRIVGLANHTVLVARDGTERPIDDSAAPILDHDGNVAGVVLVFRDVTERRRAEKANRFLASIVESSDDAIIGKDVNGTITSWNQAAERLFGYSAAEAIGRPVAILAPPDRADEMPAILNRIKRGERVDHFDTVRRAKDGRLRPISLTVSPIRDKEGRIIGASKIARDISERQGAEKALREEKERLHATLTGIGDAVIVTDAESRVTLMNPIAEALTGWKDEATGRPLVEVFRITNERTRQPAASPVERVIREGMVVGLANHTVLVAKDGTERPIDDSAAPIRDRDGRITGVVLVFRDVTERRRTVEALRQSTAHLRIVTESMAAPITHCGRDLKYKWASKPYADWINRSPDEIIDRPIIDIIGKEAFERLRPRFEQVLSGETVRYEEAVEFAGLGRRWINSVYSPTFDTAGTPDGWVAVVIDVTERKRMEESLKEADRRKDEFLATLAHELRNPLAPVRNAVELLRQAGDDPTVMQEARNIMERQLGQMVRLIDDLMDLSRVTSGKLQLRKQRVELAAAVQSAVEETRPLIEASGHELTVTLPQEPVVLNADPTRLAQVFSNLLNNSAKYTASGGHIWLTAERTDSEVVVSVRDTGIGIDTEHLPHVFEMFSQAASALERSEGGLGIGLALVRGLVELHGGTIEARSNGPGMGSEFVVRLPVLDARIPRLPEGSGHGHEKPRSSLKRRILIVDDNADSATSLALLLRRMGHEIQTAHDGLEAVQAAAAFRPQVILLDIGLPKMNGYEAAKRIREQPWQEKVTIIALTGWAQERDKQRAYDAGIDHHLTKPVEYATLETLLALITPS